MAVFLNGKQLVTYLNGKRYIINLPRVVNLPKQTLVSSKGEVIKDKNESVLKVLVGGEYFDY